jgi:uncharacterized protein
MRVVLLLPFLTGFLSGVSVSWAAQAQEARRAPTTAMTEPLTSNLRAHVLRLAPGQDLRQELQAYAQAHGLRAVSILTCVGSLTTATLRLANQEGPTVRHGHFEIVSLVGTVSVSGSHLHLAIADSTGQTIGGHLLDGCRVYTTAEIVLGELPELDFTREPDPITTYRELRVRRVGKSPKP